jgi:hypothetical protein
MNSVVEGDSAAHLRILSDSNGMLIAHLDTLDHLWSYLINIGIIMALYRYTKYALFVHMFIGLGVGLLTLITSIDLWI